MRSGGAIQTVVMLQLRLADKYFSTSSRCREYNGLLVSMTCLSNAFVMGTWPVDLAPDSSWRLQFAQDPFEVCEGALKLYTLPACVVDDAFEERGALFSLGPIRT